MKGGAFLLRTLCVLSLPLADVTPGEIKLVFFFTVFFLPCLSPQWPLLHGMKGCHNPLDVSFFFSN